MYKIILIINEFMCLFYAVLVYLFSLKNNEFSLHIKKNSMSTQINGPISK